MSIAVLHDAVPGRLRLRVTSLYRSPATAARLERSLCDDHTISVVNIDLRRGSVLLNYPADQTSGHIVEQLAACLGEQAVDRKRARRPHRLAPSGSHPPPAITDPHTRPTKELADLLGVDPATGLDDGQAVTRLLRHGPNRFATAGPRPALTALLKQLETLPVAMLGVSAAIALLTGGVADAVVILGVIGINSGIGYFTEQRAERTIRALDDVGERYSEVRRGGQRRQVPTADLVPGDVLVLGPGCRVGGDARLLHARHLTIDESALTGESLPVVKQAYETRPIDTPLGDRDNLVFMGTTVSGGNGLAMVVATGPATQIGQIQSMVDAARPPETPMERQLGRLGTQLGVLSGLVCVGVFVVGVLRGQPLIGMLNAAVSLAVAAVPEGLPAVATTTLALGIGNMRRRRVAVRKLDAIESLGALQVLCLDKTGTLTANHMAVVELHVGSTRVEVTAQGPDIASDCMSRSVRADSDWLARLVCLCSEARTGNGANGNRVDGSPTEAALIELALKAGIDVDELRDQYPLLETRERAEGRPLMSTLHRSGDRWLVAVKGSPAEIASRCDRIRRDGAVRPLSDRSRRELLAANERMAGQAQRVLAVAYRYTDRRGDMAAEHLVWVGLAGLQDPLRPGMRDLMQLYRQAGVRCVMITGDQSATAYAIGRQLGLGRDGQLEILDSSRLDRLDPDLLAALVRKVDVFARVSPAHKLRIVQAMQQAGLVVAMTGDGINDGPALKAADIGIAMGAGGSDVARSVADVVIEDDNLHTMAEAVHQGRAIYRNIRKTVHYLLSTNFSEIEVMLGALLLGLGQPLTPMQLLWINLVTDIFPGLALSLEPAEPDLMRQPPRPGGEPIITNRRLGRMALESALITGGALSAFLYGRATGGPNHGSTLAFHTLTTAQLLHALYCRSERQGLFNPGQREPNRWLELALGGTAALHMLAALLPSTRRLLNLTPVRIVDVGLILAAAASPMLLNEAAKLGIGSGDADPKDLLSKESQR